MPNENTQRLLLLRDLGGGIHDERGSSAPLLVAFVLSSFRRNNEQEVIFFRVAKGKKRINKNLKMEHWKQKQNFGRKYGVYKHV